MVRRGMYNVWSNVFRTRKTMWKILHHSLSFRFDHSERLVHRPQCFVLYLFAFSSDSLASTFLQVPITLASYSPNWNLSPSVNNSSPLQERNIVLFSGNFASTKLPPPQSRGTFLGPFSSNPHFFSLGFQPVIKLQQPSSQQGPVKYGSY